MTNKLLSNEQLYKKLRICLLCLMMNALFPVAGLGQNQVSGTIKDNAGSALSNASVAIKGSTRGTTTNASGSFSIAASPRDVLVVSLVGFENREIAVNGQTDFSIVLEVQTNSLNEVVVVGYGTQKKANLTGAVGTVTAERLTNRPIVDVGQGLQGLIPNLNISIRNGDPTSAADFNIRGYESINGGSPLILVDGVPMALELINPADIASVTVLKDAAAAAVYGARAAFGVILIETKKGKRGEKVTIQLSTEQSLAKPIFLMDVVTDPHQYVTAYNEAAIRSTGQPAFDADYVEGTKRWVENPTHENAWRVYNGNLRFYGFNEYPDRLITDFAPQQKYDMTVAGATERVNFYASFGYLNKDGYLKNKDKNEKFKRYNVLLKTDIKVNDWLSLDEKIVYNAQRSDKPHFYNWDVNINSTARQSPIALVQFPDMPYYIQQGDRDKYSQYIGKYFGGTNFFPYLEEGGRETFNKNDLWLTQGVTFTPFKGFRIRGDFSYNTFSRAYEDVASKVDIVSSNLLATPMITNGFSGDDFINNQTDQNQYSVLNAYAEYTLDQFENHFVKAMVGFNQEWGRKTYIRAQAKSLITPLIADLNATSGTQQTWGGKSHVALRGVFYRLNYIFKDKYLLEANGRYDGTSRFPEDSRYGFFPSVSAGWKISEENFMEGTRPWLDNLKVRASYGTLGNQILGNDGFLSGDFYPYIATMATGSAPYLMSNGFIPYVSPAGLVSPSLTWETVVSKNIGVDITLLKQKLDISADFYTRDTKDMLMNVEYPDILGTAAPKSNAADLRTKGWEVSATWRDKVGKNWTYGLTLALADNTTEITKYLNPNGALSTNANGTLSNYYVGQKIGEIWGYETVGLFQTQDKIASSPDQSQLGANWRPGDMQYADLNNDGKINPGNNTLSNPGDRKIIGNSTPRYSFGINGDIKFKNLTLNVFFQGLLKRDYLPENGNWQAFYPYNDGHVEKYFLTDSWSPENPDAYFAAPTFGFNTKKNIHPQSRYLQNAAYIRLKNLTLSYDIPQRIVDKVRLSRAQIYFAGMNLWEHTKMRKPLDPESVFTVTQEYYLQRIFTVGARVTF